MHRRRALPELTASNFNTRSFGERVALNMPIQGTAADMIKLAMVRVAASLRKAGLKAKMVLQIHDELLFDVPKDEVDQVVEIARREMEGAMDVGVPIVVSVGVGRSWLEAH